MPMIEVHHRPGDLTQAQKADLAERLTHVLLEIEGGEDTPAGRLIAWVKFHPVEANDWAIGGSFGDEMIANPGRFLFTVTVPEGSLSQERKSQVHEMVDAELHAALGIPMPAMADRKPSVWVMIKEMNEGNWGGMGRTFKLKDISTFVGGDPNEGPIRERSTRYLAARTAMRTHFGYPD
jgi:phenylpyruvate tautomerase PptA (4-oxalocrotonate tautomerase family)